MELLTHSDLIDLVAAGDILNTLNGGRVQIKSKLYQEEEQYMLEVSTPGIAQEAFQININGNYLTITAYHEQPLQTEDGFEDIEGLFYSKTIEIPPYVNVESIDAYYSKDQLLVVLPVSDQSEKFQRIVDIKPL